MAIADIQITPPVLRLDPVTRKGRFSVSVANQLGREGRMLVRVLPVAEARADWFKLEERYKTLTLKTDETAVFDVEVTVPADAAPQTYGFQLQCCEQLDPVNVHVESDQRDVVVLPAVAPPPPPAWRNWAIIGGAAVLLIGGGIALALWLTEPACTTGTCVTPEVASDARPATSDACSKDEGTPCGDCGGKLTCANVCSRPTPGNLRQTCNPCGGKIDCDGRCTPPSPANFNASCNRCGGRVQCNGTCSPPEPPNFGQVSVKFHVVHREMGTNNVVSFGGPCDNGFVFERAEVVPQNPPATCRLSLRNTLGEDPLRVVGSKSCEIQVAFQGAPFLGIPTICRIVIHQRRVCDPPSMGSHEIYVPGTAKINHIIR